MKISNFVAIFCFISLFYFTQNLNGQVSSSSAVADYNISVKYTEPNHLLEGKMTLEWQNTSTDTLSELYLHTYMNAFRNTESSLMQATEQKISNDFGWITLLSIQQKGNGDLSRSWEYVQTTDNNSKDQTVIKLKLKKYLLPDAKVNLHIVFQTQLPELFLRTGYVDDYIFVGQWYPQIGVYEKTAQDSTKYNWKCEQYSLNSKFYANFANYKVDITLPSDFKIGTTGISVNEKQYNNGTKTIYFAAKNVTDFAWGASKNFVEEKIKWEHVNIHILADKHHEKQIKRYKEAILKALPWYDENMGKYPYPSLTIISPPIAGAYSGSMQYPCLITTNTVKYLPKKIRIPEMSTIHEFSQQYSMLQLASKNPKESWLEEGLTTYNQTTAMDELYGHKSSVIDYKGFYFSNYNINQAKLVASTNSDFSEIADNAIQRVSHGAYSNTTSLEPAMMLHTLKGMIGKPLMDNIMQTYYEHSKFKHHSANEFIAIVNEKVTKEHGDKFGRNLNWFFNQMSTTTAVCDFKISDISINKVETHFGKYEKNGKAYFVNKKTEPNNFWDKVKSYFNNSQDLREKEYQSTVTIQRMGDIKLPVDIVVHFDNGEKITEIWEGKEHTKKLTYKRKSKVTYAHVDPENKIAIDINKINNSYVMKQNFAPAAKWTMKFLFWIENIVQFFSILV